MPFYTSLLATMGQQSVIFIIMMPVMTYDDHCRHAHRHHPHYETRGHLDAMSISVPQFPVFSILKYSENRIQPSPASVRLAKAHADRWQKQRAD